MNHTIYSTSGAHLEFLMHEANQVMVVIVKTVSKLWWCWAALHLRPQQLYQCGGESNEAGGKGGKENRAPPLPHRLHLLLHTLHPP